MDTIERICAEAGWDPFDGEPTDWAALERYIQLLEAHTRAMDMIRVPPQPRGAVAGTPEERIADVLHSIGFGAERHDLARRMLKLAQDAHAGGGSDEGVADLRSRKEA